MKRDLFREFKYSSKEDWLAQAVKELGEGGGAASINIPLESGIDIHPFYTKEDTAQTTWLREFESRLQPISPNSSTEARSWANIAQVQVRREDKANHEIKMVLKSGADGFILYLKGEVDFDKLMEGVVMEDVAVWIKVDKSPIKILEKWTAWIENQDQLGKYILGGMIWDALAYGFEIARPKKSVHEELLAMHRLTEPYPGFKGLCLKMDIYQNAGGSAVQELGYGMAALVEMADMLTNEGFSAKDIFGNLFVSTSVGGDYFLEMAKLRALRIGVYQLAELFEVDMLPEDFNLFVSTSQMTKIQHSPYNNMIRNTTEAMAAIFGGCNSLYVYPHDTAGKEEGGLSKRIARNLSLILREESFLDKVADPMAGSYYLENLINNLHEKGVNLLKKIEKDGGWWQLYQRNEIQNAIKSTRKRKRDEILNERQVVVGLNKYCENKKYYKMDMIAEETFQLKRFFLDSLFVNRK